MMCSFAVVDDDSIMLTRNPVDFELIGSDTSGVFKTYDIIRDNRSSFTIGDNFEPMQYTEDTTCCQVFRCNIAIPEDQRGAANISQLTVTWLRNEEELVHSSRIEIKNDLRYNSGNNETRYITELRLLPFEATDIGVYQCVYTDFDSDGELVLSTPFSLDTG